MFFLWTFSSFTAFLRTDASRFARFSGLLYSIILTICLCCSSAAAAARAATFSGRFHAMMRWRSSSARFSAISCIASARFSASTRAGSHSSQVKKRYDLVLTQPRFSNDAAMYLWFVVPVRCVVYLSGAQSKQ